MTEPAKKQRREMAAALRKLARKAEKRGMWMTVYTDVSMSSGADNATTYRITVEVKAPRKRRVAL